MIGVGTQKFKNNFKLTTILSFRVQLKLFYQRATSPPMAHDTADLGTWYVDRTAM